MYSLVAAVVLGIAATVHAEHSTEDGVGLVQREVNSELDLEKENVAMTLEAGATWLPKPSQKDLEKYLPDDHKFIYHTFVKHRLFGSGGKAARTLSEPEITELQFILQPAASGSIVDLDPLNPSLSMQDAADAAGVLDTLSPADKQKAEEIINNCGGQPTKDDLQQIQNLTGQDLSRLPRAALAAIALEPPTELSQVLNDPTYSMCRFSVRCSDLRLEEWGVSMALISEGHNTVCAGCEYTACIDRHELPTHDKLKIEGRESSKEMSESSGVHAVLRSVSKKIHQSLCSMQWPRETWNDRECVFDVGLCMRAAQELKYVTQGQFANPHTGGSGQKDPAIVSCRNSGETFYNMVLMKCYQSVLDCQDKTKFCVVRNLNDLSIGAQSFYKALR